MLPVSRWPHLGSVEIGAEKEFLDVGVLGVA